MDRCFGILVGLLMTAPLSAQSDLAFPHMAVGGPFETVLQIRNDVQSDNSVSLDIFQGGSSLQNNGNPLPVRFDGSAPSTSRSLTLSPLQEVTTVLSLNDPVPRNGWVRVRSTTDGGKISANLLFRQKSGGVILDSVGVTNPQRFRYAIIQVDNRQPGSDTGVAFVNPDATAVTVSLDLFQGLNSVAPEPIQVTLQPNQHFARLVSELFPAFGRQQGTLLVVAAGRSVPCVTLRLDGLQLTSLPVRPLGFTFRYEVRDSINAVVETGFWIFDFVGFDLIGTGRMETPAVQEISEVNGNWSGTSLQLHHRRTLSDGTRGMVIFNGASFGLEGTANRVVSGKVTTLGADGSIVSVNNFTAFHKFGAAPLSKSGDMLPGEGSWETGKAGGTGR
ncbi:MAG: hypothetical protein HYX74_02695 [Acidobacteria bacterium]|nr:hypothetical protein [Acidobacteriota bacterium]